MNPQTSAVAKAHAKRFTEGHIGDVNFQFGVQLVQILFALVIGGLEIWASFQVKKAGSGWSTWYLAAGITTLVSSVLCTCGLLGFHGASTNKHMFKAQYYQEHGDAEAAGKQAEKYSNDMAEHPMGPALGCCCMCLGCPAATFGVGWGIYGLVLFCQDGWTDNSKFWVWFSIAHITETILVAIFKCLCHHDYDEDEDSDDEEEGSEIEG